MLLKLCIKNQKKMLINPKNYAAFVLHCLCAHRQKKLSLAGFWKFVVPKEALAFISRSGVGVSNDSSRMAESGSYLPSIGKKKKPK
jgi:hypothetical protein